MWFGRTICAWFYCGARCLYMLTLLEWCGFDVLGYRCISVYALELVWIAFVVVAFVNC